MIAKILILATVAVANARHVVVETEGASTTSDLCPAQGHHLLPHEWDCTKFYYCEYGQKWVTPRDCAPGTEFSYEIQTCTHPVAANCQLSGVPPTSEESEESAETEAPTEVPSTEAATLGPVITTEAPTEVPSTEAATLGPVITTEAPTEVPSTEAATLGPVITTEAPTEVPSTEAATLGPVITTEAPTEVPSTEAATLGPVITTEAPTEVPSTEAATLGPVITTEAPTEVPSTEAATLGPVITTEAATEVPSTEAATLGPVMTTEAPTEVPSTEAATLGPVMTTEAPTEVPSTEAATLGPVITTEASTEVPSTEAATLGPVMTTEAPTEIPSTEAATLGPVITTEAPTEIPSTEAATLSPAITTEAATEATTEAATEAPEVELLPNGCPVDFDIHQLLPHETRCDQFYYCVFGEKVVRDCPPNTAFNPALQVCDHPENVDCVNASGSSDEASGSSETSEEAPESSETSGEDLEGSGEVDIGVEEFLPNGCPADFDVHKLLPHDYECAKFYYCVFGEKVERDCAPGTYFSPALQVCDFPENVVCVGKAGSSIEASSEEKSASEEVGPTLPNGCPADFDVHQLLPHESDCAKFYYCVFGEKVERDCAPGTHFSPTLQVCVWPEDAGCANAGSNENESTGSAENGNSQENSDENGNSEETNNSSEEVTTTTTAAPETDPTTPATNSTTPAPITLPTEAPEIELLPNGCPADFDVHQLLPHESDCAKFYYCVFGEKVERDCAPGTHFSPTLQVCVWPEDAGCANAGSNENESTGSAENGNSQENSDENGNSEETDNSSEEVTTTTTAAPETDPTTPATDSTTPAPITLPTEAPEIELLPNGCPADFDVHQLLPHESDCAKFYYCVFGEKVERDCAPGTHFSPTLQVCVWPEDAGCANAGSNENESTGSAENGNSQENGDENGNSEETDNSSEEVTTTTTAAPETDPITPATDPTTPATNSTTPAPITLPTEAPEIELLPNGCPADFDVHQLLPHESDCAKFYYCVFGEKVERDCAPGTHFSPTLQVCVWPEDAGCANAGSNENESTGSAENGNSQENSDENGNSEETDNSSEEVTTTTTAAPETDPTTPATDSTTPAPITLPTEAPEIELLPNGCPADFDVHQLLPHESDCAKFYYCVFGEKVERDCAPGTHFSPTLQVCVWPEDAGCANAGSNENESTGSAENGNSQENSDENGNSEETDNSSEEVTTTTTAAPETDPTTPATDSTTPAPITLPTEAPEIELLPNGCPADFDVHQLLPHESDCAKFYYCVFGEKVERECAPGTHFSPTLQVCVWPEDAGCANAGSNENESTGSAENGNSQENSDENGNSEETDNSSEEVTTTTTAAPETDPTTPATDPTTPATNSTTPAPITLPTEAPEIELLPNGCPADFDVHQLLPHESDCAKFYYCVFGEKVERDCAPGTHFNPTLQVCDRPENAGCANIGGGEGSGDSAENGSQDASNENNNQESGANESAESGSQQESDKCKTACNVGAWAHEHDCDKFWRCDGENAVLGTCAEGLHFNVQTQTCDFICNAGCVRDDVQSTAEKEGLKLFLPWNKVDKTIRKLYLGQ
ncbi:mucin-17-like [Cydia amplana]|uniref:mucin-17-like n=1 Tax=Cydia amplana TaxID=1869771 RepID=UPI002FE6A9B1